MLILSRRVGETIIIGDNIKITVLNPMNGKMRLGFDAPEDVAIYREEIYARMQAEKTEAQGNRL